MAIEVQTDRPQPERGGSVVDEERRKINGLIRNRLIFCFLLVSLTPILIIGFLAYHTSRAAITKKITQYSQAELVQTVANIQFETGGVRKYLRAFIYQ